MTEKETLTTQREAYIALANAQEYQSKVDDIILQWAKALSESQILAMNCISPLAEKGCGHFELCEACHKKGYCIDYMAKKFLDKYFDVDLELKKQRS
jgi:hypothetical protein